jgi:PAS domain S-box-containing protein
MDNANGNARGGPDSLDQELAVHLGTIFSLLHKHTGHDFGRYKPGTMLRRIRRRIQALHAASVADYLTLLQHEPPEAQALLDELLIDVTPHAEAIEELENELRMTRAELRNAIERLESSNEEIRSANQKIISTNEELQSANEEMQRRTAELDATLASMATGVVIFGPDGQKRFGNQAAQDVLEYTPEEQALTGITERVRAMAFRKEDGSPVALDETPAARALRGEVSKNAIMLVRRPSRDIWVSVNAAPIRGPNGELLGAVSCIVDITQRRQMEARAAWLASFPERNPHPVTEISLAGQIHYANPAARRLFPDLEKEGLAHPWLGDWAAAIRPLQDNGETTVERTVTVGQATYAQSLYLVREAGRVRVYGRDITARRRAERQVKEQSEKLGTIVKELQVANQRLREDDQRKNEFLAMLSHELRNPLAPIRNSLTVLDRAERGSDQAKRAQATIDRQTAHLTRLVDDLLDIARISRGKIQLRKQPVNLGDLARRTVEDHRSFFAADGLELEVAVSDAGLWVDGDATRLSQVLGNLLHNAAKFSDRGGQASVSAVREQNTAVIRVRDTGVGLSQEMLARVFEPFTQAETTLDRARGGLGLGLALVKGLVELHDGSVAVESAGPGQGAEFTVRLPLRELADGSEAAPTASRALATRRVLVIEDNLDAAESLREVLEFGGHAVEIANNGSSGIEQARAFRPDMILCDIGLPGMDGYEVARRLRAEATLASTYLVALTGYALPEDLAKAKEAGFDEHIAKPASLERIEQVLANAPR